MPKPEEPGADPHTEHSAEGPVDPSVSQRLQTLRGRVREGGEKMDVLQNALVEMADVLETRLSGLQEQLATLQQDLKTFEQRVDRVAAESVHRDHFSEALDDIRARLRQVAAGLEGIRSFSALSADDFSYFKFEDLHRGTAEHVTSTLTPYLGYFSRCQRVADLGCGRGEFLDLCRSKGIGAYGVDSNEDMVLHCERLGLNVVSADIVEHLRSLPEKWLDGVFCSQVIEHLPLSRVQVLLRESARVLKVGTHIVIVTINPLSLFALANNFFLDPTHVRPLPPGTMKFLAEEAGFRSLDIQYYSPFGEEYSLLPVTVDNETEWQRALRINFERLNHIVLGHQEYALIGLK